MGAQDRPKSTLPGTGWAGGGGSLPVSTSGPRGVFSSGGTFDLISRVIGAVGVMRRG
jgi:hypothetical protein